jgi:DNA-binding NtrC family response regulator
MTRESTTIGSILIVEDDTGLRQMLTWELEELGYEVSAAGCCADARALIEQGHFDLALLDYQLPDGIGLELVAALLARRPATRIIVTSGCDAKDIAPRVRASGAWRFCTKPTSPKRLDQLLRASLATVPR